MSRQNGEQQHSCRQRQNQSPTNVHPRHQCHCAGRCSTYKSRSIILDRKSRFPGAELNASSARYTIDRIAFETVIHPRIPHTLLI